VNQLITLAEQLDADVWQAINAAEIKPFGLQVFKAGLGIGGHCPPIDPQFLTWRANEVGTEFPFIKRAHKMNERMLGRVVEEVTTALKTRDIPLGDASMLVSGVAYKPNVGDQRNSPAIDVFGNLRN